MILISNCFFGRLEFMNVGSDVETRQTSNPWIVNNSRTMLDKDCHYKEFCFFLLKRLCLFLSPISVFIRPVPTVEKENGSA